MAALRLSALLFGCCGCFGSHELAGDEPDAFDAEVALDAEVGDALIDAALIDAISMDVHRPDGGPVDTGVAPSPDLTFDVPAHRLHGARWGENMSLLVSFQQRAEAPIEVWTFDRVSASLPIEAAQVVRGTVGANAAAASRWGDVVAIAVERPSGPHDVILFELSTGRVLAQWVPDPTLMRPRVFHVFVALDQTRLLTIWLDPDSVQRYRVVSYEGGVVREITSGLAGTNSLSAAARLAADEPVVSEILHNRLGAGFDAVVDRPERHWVADGSSLGGASVAAFDRGSLFVDGELRSDDVPPVSVMYGYMTYAGGLQGLVAMATGSGLLAGSIDADLVTWTHVDARFPAGSPVAHVNDMQRGFFFVEGAIGFQPARLRWVGL